MTILRRISFKKSLERFSPQWGVSMEFSKIGGVTNGFSEIRYENF